MIDALFQPDDTTQGLVEAGRLRAHNAAQREQTALTEPIC
jgi:hypothetical protein